MVINNQRNLLRSIQNIKPTCESLDELEEWRNTNTTKQYVLSILHININSLKKNWDLLVIKIKNLLSELDLLILTEINIKEQEALAYHLQNFEQINKCRIRRKGGGVLVFYKTCWEIEDLKYNLDEAENLNLRITNKDHNVSFVILAIYRSPKNNLPKFLSDLNFWLTNGCKKEENVVMIGDINICILKKTSMNTSYLNTLYNSSLVPFISSPTREEMLDGVPTVSCLDHINLRLKRRDLSASSAVICDKLADHYFIACRIQFTTPDPASLARRRNPPIVEIIDNREAQRKIELVDWESMKQIEDPLELHEQIVSKFQTIYESSKKNIIMREQKKESPWINERVRFEIQKKNKLLKNWRNNKSNNILYESYKRQRNVTTNLVKKEKRIYIFKMFQEAKGDMLKTWRLINDLMNRKIQEPVEIKIQQNFPNKDLKILADSFNKNFIQQIDEIKNKNKGPNLDVNMYDYEPLGNICSMYLRKATENDVYKILKNMKKRGRGCDGIRNKDIILNRITFTPLVTHLVNLMLTKSLIPEKLKTSCVTPLFKKGKPDNMANYRPVGSLPIIEKVLEKHINSQTLKYLERNEIIPEFQHGFQSGKSTTTLLQDFADQIYTALDERKSVVVLLLDLSFSFDTCDHAVLLKKFQDIGMNHPIFAEYLRDRRQITRIGQVSDKLPVKYGFVQGACNSPTWFNIYTYDIRYVKRTSTLRQFADDSALVAIHKDVRTAVAIIQRDFINLQKYLYNNHIYINEKKTEALVLGYMSKQVDMNRHQITCHSRPCLANKTYLTSCNCHKIDYKSNAKYLGILIDNELKMNQHVYNLCNKLRVLKFKLDQVNAGKFPMTTKVTIYFSLVDSLLRYAVTLYTFAPKYAMEPLNKQQRKIRNILFGQSNIPCMTPEELSIFTLINANFHNEKFRQLTEHPYELRTQRFSRPHVYTTQYGEKRLAYIVPTLLNSYCQDFLQEENKNTIKNNIKKSILSKR